jgi:predicted protein tyrosine phosphatase
MGGFNFQWVEVTPGRLALWHRPKLRAIPYLRNAGCDRVLSLLSEREGAAGIGQAVEQAGLAWSWFPLATGRPPQGRAAHRVRAGVVQLSRRLDAGESILIHCSAGMHRTGMVAYALLRFRGLEKEAALELIAATRPVTRSALTPEHLRWGDQEMGVSGDQLERMARAIHARYLKHQQGRKPASDPAMQPWEALPESLKRSNRDQAADIERKLLAIGCAIGPASGGPAVTLSTEQLERLAILEHERWVADRRAAGWTPGPVRDVARMLTPDLAPWEALAEPIREYDREAVRVIPEVLAEVGLAMYRR